MLLAGGLFLINFHVTLWTSVSCVLHIYNYKQLCVNLLMWVEPSISPSVQIHLTTYKVTSSTNTNEHPATILLGIMHGGGMAQRKLEEIAYFVNDDLAKKIWNFSGKSDARTCKTIPDGKTKFPVFLKTKWKFWDNNLLAHHPQTTTTLHCKYH